MSSFTSRSRTTRKYSLVVSDLNFKNITGLSLDNLNKIFERDPNKFFAFADMKNIRYNAKLTYLNENRTETVDGVLEKVDDMQLILNNIAAMKQFIDSACGLVQDEDNDKLFTLEKDFEKLTNSYNEVLALYKTRLHVLEGNNLMSTAAQLNLVGVQETTYEELSKVFTKNQEKFFGYAMMKNNRYLNKLKTAYYKSVKIKVIDVLYVKSKEIQIIRNNVNIFIKFINDLYTEFNQDLINKVLELENIFQVLSDLYCEKHKEFDEMIIRYNQDLLKSKQNDWIEENCKCSVKHHSYDVIDSHEEVHPNKDSYSELYSCVDTANNRMYSAVNYSEILQEDPANDPEFNYIAPSGEKEIEPGGEAPIHSMAVLEMISIEPTLTSHHLSEPVNNEDSCDADMVVEPNTEDIVKIMSIKDEFTNGRNIYTTAEPICSMCILVCVCLPYLPGDDYLNQVLISDAENNSYVNIKLESYYMKELIENCIDFSGNDYAAHCTDEYTNDSSDVSKESFAAECIEQCKAYCTLQNKKECTAVRAAESAAVYVDGKTEVTRIDCNAENKNEFSADNLADDRLGVTAIVADSSDFCISDILLCSNLITELIDTAVIMSAERKADDAKSFQSESSADCKMDIKATNNYLMDNGAANDIHNHTADLEAGLISTVPADVDPDLEIKTSNLSILTGTAKHIADIETDVTDFIMNNVLNAISNIANKDYDTDNFVKGINVECTINLEPDGAYYVLKYLSSKIKTILAFDQTDDGRVDFLSGQDEFMDTSVDRINASAIECSEENTADSKVEIIESYSANKIATYTSRRVDNIPFKLFNVPHNAKFDIKFNLKFNSPVVSKDGLEATILTVDEETNKLEDYILDIINDCLNFLLDDNTTDAVYVHDADEEVDGTDYLLANIKAVKSVGSDDTLHNASYDLVHDVKPNVIVDGCTNKNYDFSAIDKVVLNPYNQTGLNDTDVSSISVSDIITNISTIVNDDAKDIIISNNIAVDVTTKLVCKDCPIELSEKIKTANADVIADYQDYVNANKTSDTFEDGSVIKDDDALIVVIPDVHRDICALHLDDIIIPTDTPPP